MISGILFLNEVYINLYNYIHYLYTIILYNHIHMHNTPTLNKDIISGG